MPILFKLTIATFGILILAAIASKPLAALPLAVPPLIILGYHAEQKNRERRKIWVIDCHQQIIPSSKYKTGSDGIIEIIEPGSHRGSRYAPEFVHKTRTEAQLENIHWNFQFEKKARFGWNDQCDDLHREALWKTQGLTRLQIKELQNEKALSRLSPKTA